MGAHGRIRPRTGVTPGHGASLGVICQIKCEGLVTVQQGFQAYAEAVKERLAKHGFLPAFQLEEDLGKQDQLTTWIEYLAHEYWWYDWYGGSDKSQAQQYHKAWQDLLDSNVLRTGETKEIMSNTEYIYEQAGPNAFDEQTAEMAVQSARTALSSTLLALVESTRQSDEAMSALQQQVVTAQLELKNALERHDVVKKRNRCISQFNRQTKTYRCVKRDTEHHHKLIRWILAQIPVIKDEMQSHELSQDKSSSRSQYNVQKSDEAGSIPKMCNVKRQEQTNDIKQAISSQRESHGSRCTRKRSRSGSDAAESEPLSKRLDSKD